MIRRFHSVTSLAAECTERGLARGISANGRDYAGRDAWMGNESVTQTLQFAQTGDRSYVAEAESLLDKLETSIEVPRKVWERNVAGPICVVPDIVAGLPTPFRRQKDVGDDRAPITIIACSTISADVSTSTIRRRGIAILALVLALSRIRPVSLHTVATTDGERGDRDETVICTRIETAPLDLSMACWALTSAGFARRLNYFLASEINGFRGGWPRRFDYSNPEPYMTYLRNVLSDDPNRTLIIKPTHSLDPLATNPVPWLNEQITKFTQTMEEELV